MRIIYRKSDLVCVGVIQDNTDFEWEIEHNVIPNYGGTINDYDHMEHDYSRFHLERVDSEVMPLEDGLTLQEQKNIILKQLAELDLIVPRIVEDIVSQGTFNLHQSKIDIITQKAQLRLQLQELEV